MPYDLSEVIDDIKSQVSDVDRKKTAKIHVAIGLCLDDMSERMKSVAMIENYTVSVTADSRTVTLEGDNLDMQQIYYLKWSTGDDQKPLVYKPPEYFIEEYDNPSAAAGVPTYYTILLNDDGFPIVKFNCPVSSTDTLTVYYFKEALPENMARFRSKIAVMCGALSYFKGRVTSEGKEWYRAFEVAVVLAMSSDAYMADELPRMILSIKHRRIRDIVWTLRNRRS